MSVKEEHTIYTIGHSTHTGDEFLEMLNSFQIKYLVDIRRFPGSRKFPQFNTDQLQPLLNEAGITYTHLVGLGGRRKASKDSLNCDWKNSSFRGYADYMETNEFDEAVLELEKIALQQPTAYMCSEAVWWRCHRSMVSDFLMAKGWKVLHIMGIGKSQEHRYTSPARVSQGRVIYHD
ncbi:MAG TPA: DUF488 domain-containing protein [Saprospiraceae bacterium]|nr:DUF488 domain-containing protein [Saprospiraceae bacterium]